METATMGGEEEESEKQTKMELSAHNQDTKKYNLAKVKNKSFKQQELIDLTLRSAKKIACIKMC